MKISFFDMNQIKQPKYTRILPIRMSKEILSFEQKTYKRNIPPTFLFINDNKWIVSIFGYCG